MWKKRNDDEKSLYKDAITKLSLAISSLFAKAHVPPTRHDLLFALNMLRKSDFKGESGSY